MSLKVWIVFEINNKERVFFDFFRSLCSKIFNISAINSSYTVALVQQDGLQLFVALKILKSFTMVANTLYSVLSVITKCCKESGVVLEDVFIRTAYAALIYKLIPIIFSFCSPAINS